MNRDPKRMADSRVLLRGPRAQECHEEYQRGAKTAEFLRDLVLSHKDLARKLTDPPLGLSVPASWNGFVPPVTNGPMAGRNGSPVRDQLIPICHEAIRRSRSQAEADEWKALVS